MIKKKKILVAEELPGFEESIEIMPEESKIIIDKSMEIAHCKLKLMELKQNDMVQQVGKQGRSK